MRCRAALLQPGGGGAPVRGLAYTLSVSSQHNIILVVTRAVKPGAASGAPAAAAAPVIGTR